MSQHLIHTYSIHQGNGIKKMLACSKAKEELSRSEVKRLVKELAEETEEEGCYALSSNPNR